MHQVVIAEPGHFLANLLVDVTFLLEQLLQLAVLILKVVHFQFEALHLCLVVLLLLPLVVFQYSDIKQRFVKQVQNWTTLILSELLVGKNTLGGFL